MDTHQELWRYCSQILRDKHTAETENVPQTTTITTSYQDATELAKDVTDTEFSASCYEYLKYNYEVLTKYSFATEGIGLFTVAVVGVFANLLSIAVLCERTMKTQITALLITLAVFDTVFLLCCIPVFSIASVRGFVDYLNACVYKEGA